jgi:hypothetical protein
MGLSHVRGIGACLNRCVCEKYARRNAAHRVGPHARHWGLSKSLCAREICEAQCRAWG